MCTGEHPRGLKKTGDRTVVKIVEKLLRAGEGRQVKRLHGLAAQVNALEEDFVQLSDAELREETDRFRARVADGETLDELLPEAFSAVREAANFAAIKPDAVLTALPTVCGSEPSTTGG